jgi:phage protein D
MTRLHLRRRLNNWTASTIAVVAAREIISYHALTAAVRSRLLRG